MKATQPASLWCVCGGHGARLVHVCDRLAADHLTERVPGLPSVRWLSPVSCRGTLDVQEILHMHNAKPILPPAFSSLSANSSR
ncbi:MAG: hypothetical protein WDW36_000863 [Sanguina aurantia]